MAGELEEPEDPDDREELEDVCIFYVGHMLLEEEVGVEADGGDVVDHVHRGLQEVTFVGTRNEPASSCISVNSKEQVNSTFQVK